MAKLDQLSEIPEPEDSQGPSSDPTPALAQPAPAPVVGTAPPKPLDPDEASAGSAASPSHGAPVRLFVPGWYGVASVKWLSRIEVLDHAFRGYYQSVKYTVQKRGERGCRHSRAPRARRWDSR